jgi:hypothetical protein
MRYARYSHMRLAAVLAAFLALAASASASRWYSTVRGSGVINGDNHFRGNFKTGRFAVSVAGRSGSIRYINRAQRVSFRSGRITLNRDESFDRFKIVVVAGRGTMNGRVVRFYVRAIDEGGPPNDVFYIVFRTRRGFWISEAGGRLWSGRVSVS